MSSRIPPFLSASPPPFDEDGPACEDDEDFGDFHDFSSAISVPSETSLGDVGNYFRPIENVDVGANSLDQRTTSPLSMCPAVASDGSQSPSVPPTMNSINPARYEPMIASCSLPGQEMFNSVVNGEGVDFDQNIKGFEARLSSSQVSVSSEKEVECSSFHQRTDEISHAKLADDAIVLDNIEKHVTEECVHLASNSNFRQSAELDGANELSAVHLQIATKMQGVCEEILRPSSSEKIESDEFGEFETLPTTRSGTFLNSDLYARNGISEASGSDWKMDDSATKASDWQTIVVNQTDCHEIAEDEDFSVAPDVLVKSMGDEYATHAADGQTSVINRIGCPELEEDENFSAFSAAPDVLVKSIRDEYATHAADGQTSVINRIGCPELEEDENFSAFSAAPDVLVKSIGDLEYGNNKATCESLDTEATVQTTSINEIKDFESEEDDEFSAFADAPVIVANSCSEDTSNLDDIAVMSLAPESDWLTTATKNAPTTETENEKFSDFADAATVHVKSNDVEHATKSEVGDNYLGSQSEAVCITKRMDGTTHSDQVVAEKQVEFGDEFDDFEEFKVAETADMHGTPKFAAIQSDEQWCAFNNSAAADEDDDWAAFQEPVTDVASEKPVETYHTSVQNVLTVDKSLSTSPQELLSRALKNCFPNGVRETMIDESALSVQSLRNMLNCVSGPQSNSVLEHSYKIWTSLRVMENTVALKYQWTGSRSNDLLLKAVNVDARNILIGHRNKSSAPVFASSLGLLEPKKASAMDQSRPVTGSILIPTSSITHKNDGLDGKKDALFGRSKSQFDGSVKKPDRDLLDVLELTDQSSGKSLPRPFDNILASMTSSSAKVPANQAVRKTNVSSEPLSVEAAAVLAHLPDLSFMHAKVLMFPVGDITN